MDFSNIAGGWCKHGIMEANPCKDCQEEWRAAGRNFVYHEGDMEEFKRAMARIKNLEQKPE